MPFQEDTILYATATVLEGIIKTEEGVLNDSKNQMSEDINDQDGDMMDKKERALAEQQAGARRKELNGHRYVYGSKRYSEGDLEKIIHELECTEVISIGHQIKMKVQFPEEPAENLTVHLLPDVDARYISRLFDGFSDEVVISEKSVMGQALKNLPAGGKFEYESEAGKVTGRILEVLPSKFITKEQ